MPFRGNVVGMALEDLIGFLAQHGAAGALRVTRGDDAELRLHMLGDGRLFFPHGARRGTYSLGKLLRHTGVLSREALADYERDRRRLKAQLLEASTTPDAPAPELEDAQRLQYTEELHDLFLWDDARFVFEPGELPPRVAQDLQAKRGLVIDAQGLLFEVARRADERRRVQRLLPSSRLLLTTTPGADADVLEALRALQIDALPEHSPFDGEHSVEDLLAQWGVPRTDALAEIGRRIELGQLAPMSVPDALELARATTDRGDLFRAARALGHLAASDNPPSGLNDRLAAVVDAAAFDHGPPANFSLRLEGARAFFLTRLVLERPSAEGTASVIVHGRRELRLQALPAELRLRAEVASTPGFGVYLQRLKVIPPEHVERVDALDPKALADKLDPDAFEAAKALRLCEEVALLARRGRVDVELSNREAPMHAAELELRVRLTEAVRKRLERELGRWAEILDALPSEALRLVPGDASVEDDPAAAFFGRFDLTRSVSDLRRQAKARPLEFARFVFRGLQRDYLRLPSFEELRAAREAAVARGDNLSAGRLAEAARAQGIDLGEDAHDAAVDQTPGVPVLEGDLEGVGLGAVLQVLREQRRTGTLSVRAGRTKERVLFHQGEAYLFQQEDAEAEAFAAYFLGDDGDGGFGDDGGAAGRGLIGEQDLDEAEAYALKHAFLDLMLDDGATFAFFHEELPEGFFDLGEGVTKVALDTQNFLIEAMGLMAEWDELRVLLDEGNAVFAFAPGKQLEAMQAFDNAPSVLLIDGQRDVNAILQGAGVSRLELGRLIRQLVDTGLAARA